MLLLLRNSAAPGPVTGTLSQTLGSLSLTAFQTTPDQVIGNLGGGGGGSSFAGLLALRNNTGGGAPAILGAVTLSAQGNITVTGPITGFLSRTLDPLTLVPRQAEALKSIIEIGLGNLGDSLMRTLINQEHVVFCTSNSGLSGAMCKDLSPQGNHGTWEGSIDYAAVFGISLPEIPEGGLATAFFSLQQARIPNDGLTTGPNLSLAGGGFDIFIIMLTGWLDSSQRAIVSKYDNDTQTGYFVFLEGGRLTGRLLINGSLIFSVTTDFGIADSTLKRCHLCYEPEQNRVRWFINGTQSGPTVNASTEPAPNNADLIIGGWSFRNDPNFRYIGYLHYVMIGREGNSLLSSMVEPTLVWTDVSNYVRDLRVELGDTSLQPVGTTAPTARASFKLLNNDPLGLFSPESTFALPGFGLANPIRIRTSEGTLVRPLYRGFISDINPATGEHGERMTAVDCVDYTEVLAVTPIGELEVNLAKQSDYCIRRLIDQTTRPPVAVSFELGNEVFPTAFDQVDGITGRILQELAEVVRSEGGMFYVKRDGTLTFESRTHRQLIPTPVATLTGDWLELEVGQGLHEIINLQRATVYPREFGTVTTTVLAGHVSTDSTRRRILLPPGEQVPIEGSFSDPEERSTAVGGMDIQTLQPFVDYTVTQNEDGGGNDLTSQLEFISGNPPKGGASYSMVVRLNGSSAGWFAHQVRGRILRRFDPKSTYFEDPDSRNKYFHREPVSLNLRYLSDVTQGYSRCKYMVNLYKTPKSRPRVFQAIVNLNDPILRSYLSFDIGDPIRITESVSGLGTGIFWAANLVYEFVETGVIRITVTVVPSSVTGSVFIVGNAIHGVVGSAIVGF